ncbi:hypothetical protein T02_13732 [Trichinella nativa]|uniref:DUF5641 domain-containing protein n=1 Tax=Trichinella nativa TaxID=6335 RepID=A0A0V1KYM9_9BILA|nr:hypothetical protein T02_13732 [Trichinella nativa]
MGELPAERVTPTGPFQYVGIIFAGLIIARSGKTRHELVKMYVCVFTCLVVRVIHLELVMDMDYELPGRVTWVYFEASSTQAHPRTLADERIEWKFITERAPWCGGCWERLVQSVKLSLIKVLGRKRVNPEELRTVLCEIEAIINDRTLTIVSDRAYDDMALNLAHFLSSRELSSLPDRDRLYKLVRRDNRSLALLHRRWRHQRKMVDHLWSHWKREYLVTLSAPGKWKEPGQQPSVGDIVLMTEQNLPRS